MIVMYDCDTLYMNHYFKCLVQIRANQIRFQEVYERVFVLMQLIRDSKSGCVETIDEGTFLTDDGNTLYEVLYRYLREMDLEVLIACNQYFYECWNIDPTIPDEQKRTFEDGYYAITEALEQRGVKVGEVALIVDE